MPPINYETLRLIWWAFLGLLLIGFAVTDGFDLGAALLQPLVARTDTEKRLLLNAIGPVWEGNQVWFILGGGAAFAAWPPLYAVSFSGFYLAMFLVLAALILRPVAFTFRSKLEGAGWRSTWDWAFFVSGLVPALVFGVAFGNLFPGVPFRFDDTLRVSYEGGLLGLLNPWAFLCGLVSVAMLAMHGGSWLALKTEGALAHDLTIPNMHCEHCLARIREAAPVLPGVVKVVGDPAVQRVTVTYRRGVAEPDGIREAIIERGFGVA